MRKKNPENLLRRHFLITEAQSDFLDTFGEQHGSLFVRKLISAQMSGHEVEISKLKDEARQHELQLNIIYARISELEAADQRKQAAGETREQLMERVSDRLIKGNQDLDFKDRDFVRIINTNLDDANRVLVGYAEPIGYDELKTLTIKKAEARGMHIYG